MAATAQDPQNKAVLHDLAKRWRRLAEESKGDALKAVGGRRSRPGENNEPRQPVG